MGTEPDFQLEVRVNHNEQRMGLRIWTYRLLCIYREVLTAPEVEACPPAR